VAAGVFDDTSIHWLREALGHPAQVRQPATAADD